MTNQENKTQEQINQEKQERIIEREVGDFTARLIPFGSADIRAAVETALEAGYDGDWAADQIEEFMDSTDTKLADIDPNYVVYDSLLQTARNDIDSAIGTDILNDTNRQVEVYANFMCTSLDYSEEAQKELAEIMAKIPREDFTDAMTWLWKEAELDSVKIQKEEDA